MVMSEEQEILHEQAERQYLQDQSRLSTRRTQQQLDRAIREDGQFIYRTDSGILVAERTGNSGNQRISERGVPSRGATYQGLGLMINDDIPNLYRVSSLSMNPATRLWLEYNRMFPPRPDRTADIARANSLGR
jgi:hypothetical protein